MARLEKRVPLALMLLAVSGVILLADLALDRVALSPPQTTGLTYPWAGAIGWYIARFIMVPILPVFSWPLGLWFWRYAPLQHGAIERAVPRIIAVVCWLVALLTIYGLLRSWFFA